MIKSRAIIFDLDGTLSDDRWRRKFSDGKDWENYHQRSPEDKPNRGACELFNLLASGVAMCIVSGRPGKHRATTIEWISTHISDWAHLIMRPEGEKSGFGSAILKKEAAEYLLKYYDVVAAFDNCDADIAAYRSLGIPTYKVKLQGEE